MEINGLPLHVLVVHAAVVLTPIAALAAVAYCAVPAWREWLRWPLAVAVVVAVVVVWVAYLSGSDFRDDERFATATGEFARRLDDHEELGSLLRWVASGFAAATLAMLALRGRGGALGVLLTVAAALLAAATLVVTVMTGDAGAQAVWGS